MSAGTMFGARGIDMGFTKLRGTNEERVKLRDTPKKQPEAEFMLDDIDAIWQRLRLNESKSI